MNVIFNIFLEGNLTYLGKPQKNLFSGQSTKVLSPNGYKLKNEKRKKIKFFFPKWTLTSPTPPFISDCPLKKKELP